MIASTLRAPGSSENETLPTAPLRLAELVGALAIATDAGAALPPESSLRTSIIALELGRRLGLAEASLRDVFYAALLRHIGCSAVAHEESQAHRAAWPLDQIARHLEKGVVGGAFCREAVDAVLGVLGARPSRARATLPAGFSEREVEVLGLVARGLTDKEIAGRLGISHRTVQHHNRHAFDKIGVSTRGAVALFVIEHGLLPR